MMKKIRGLGTSMQWVATIEAKNLGGGETDPKRPGAEGDNVGVASENCES